MPIVRRRATVPYSPDQMFDLVNDVESYPEFLRWCRSATVAQCDERTVEAALDIGIGGIHKRFVTRNSSTRPTHIGIELLAGPFQRLKGSWTFTDSAAGGSDVELELDFEMAHTPLGLIFSAAFEEIARAQMNAFIKRAERIYG